MAGEVGSYEPGNNQKHAVKAKLHIDTDEWQSSCFCAVLMNAYIYAYIYKQMYSSDRIIREEDWSILGRLARFARLYQNV